MLRQAVVLVGGLGTRLGELTARTPKPMLPIGDGPFLDILLRNLARFGLAEALLLARHHAEVIREHYARHPIPGLELRIFEETEPAGTGGALRDSADALDDVFLLTNGDSFFDINYLALHQGFDPARTDVSIALCRVPDVSRYGQVRLGRGGHVTGYAEKSGAAGAPGLISGGVYIVSRRIVSEIGPGPMSLETAVVPGLVARGRVTGQEFDGYFIDIGLPESYRRGQRDLPLRERRPAVFMDRSVLITDPGPDRSRPGLLEIRPDVREAIRAVNDIGRLVVVLTNGPGDAEAGGGDPLRDRINRQLAPHGAHVDAVLAGAPMLQAGAEFDRACRDRKIDLDRSVIIGDKVADHDAVRACGVQVLPISEADMTQLTDRLPS